MKDSLEYDSDRLRKLKTWESVTLVGVLAILIAGGGLSIASSTRQESHLSTAALVFLTSVCRLVSNVGAFSYQTVSQGGPGAGVLLASPGASPTKASFYAQTGRWNGPLTLNLHYAVPALLYTFSDNIAFVVLAKINPATFSILWNSKTAFVAVFLRLFLIKEPFPWVKWGGVALLLVGPTLIEIGSKKDIMKGTLGQPAPIYWHMLCLLGAFISAASNVYTEWALKKHKTDPLLWQNIQLYGCSTAFTLIGLVAQHGLLSAVEVFSPEFLIANVSGMALLAMLCQTTQSFLVPAILKYLDNIADLYAHACAVIITAFASWMFFNLDLTIYFMLGISASIGSLFLYYAEKLCTCNEPHVG
mmetsp:Transcript_20031/g.27737  ORF Transcript_20031/g.27737 Transcript_20031/m.27737 type:complete len:360 (+) Transcript_20031:204-1283(+)|eukprot:CAMPEP_0196586548 /NCGR_PEP_ID=MMETSP1081-20130531/54720_1 /TAXON_ID=36882 /ORGANISM="Pyramimonas amylifera, Strain CCMP720" /LENGTH=359 /DNA_ID=CAMNT_0041908465 /DNA_START=63 /DNA_END=1142 /DNA_ORIENTATION=+